ncbi:MAG: hypothetical protein KH373_01925 [Ruminococcus sp.]|nr:hypothetical protein [Ruminococcus sp.]
MNNQNLEIDRRIKKEETKLKKIFKDKGIDVSKNSAIQSLISRASFMKVSLENLEQDLKENGWTELFQQGKDQKPYERQRPTATTYTSLNTNYQKIIKQLTDLLPKSKSNIENQTDTFEEFVYSRDEV